MRLLMVAIYFYMLWSYRAKAEIISTSAPTDTAKTSEKKFALELDWSVDSNMRESSDSQYESNTTFAIAPSYSLSAGVTLAANLAIEQKLYADTATSLSNTQISLARKPIPIGHDRALSGTVFGVLPTNEIDRNDNTLYGSTGVAGTVLQNYTLSKKMGSLAYSLSLLKNYHQFERTNSYKANLSHRVRHIVTLNQEITKKMSFEVTGYYQTGWTYQSAFRTTFSLSEKIAYNFGDSSTWYVGHTNGGNALKANGVDSNIQLYDESQSSFVMGMTTTY